MFKLVDASAIVFKTALWEEWDKAIANGEEKLNSKNAESKDARWKCPVFDFYKSLIVFRNLEKRQETKKNKKLVKIN